MPIADRVKNAENDEKNTPPLPRPPSGRPARNRLDPAFELEEEAQLGLTPIMSNSKTIVVCCFEIHENVTPSWTEIIRY